MKSIKYHLLRLGVAALTTTLLSSGVAHAAITNTLTISSSSHTENQSSTISDIAASWTTATSDVGGDLTYEFVLDQTSTHTPGSFETNLDATNTSTLITGTLTNATSKTFSSVVDGTFYLHVRAYDSAGPASGTDVDTFGPIILDTAPTLATSPISPATGDHTQAISVTITGSKFIDGASLQLVNGTRNGTTLSDVNLTNETVANNTTITATVPIDTVPGTYDLKVTNGGAHGQQVTAVDKYQSTNQLPVANAGTDQTLTLSGSTVTLNLDGTSSSDPDGDTLASYSWTTATQPSGSSQASTFSGSTKTLTLNTAGSYEFSLVVNDGFEDSLADTVAVTVSSTANNPPTANAGSDQTVTPTSQVTLNGSQSADSDSDALTYSWSITSLPTGSSLSTGSASINQTATTDTTATFTPDIAGEYTISLTVNDGTVDSTADSMVVTANTKPTASASASSTSVTAGTLVTLDGTASSDTDTGDTLTYAWTLTTPAGSSDTLSSTTASQPTFTPSCAGDYVASLTVNDGKQDSASAASVTVTATGSTCATLDVDGDGDGDANDGLMVQRRLTGAGTVSTGIVLPTAVGGSGTSGARTDAEIVAAIDSFSTALDVDGDSDADANDGLMIQRRLTGAGTVATGVVLPTGVGGSGTSGAYTDAEVVSAIDALTP